VESAVRPLDKALDAFYRNSGKKHSGRGPVYGVFCPCHPDKKRSVAITEQEDGSLLIHCYVCGRERTDDILEAVGLSSADLFPGSRDGFYSRNDIDVSNLLAAGSTGSKLKKLLSTFKAYSASLPDGPTKAGWEHVLQEEEIGSLVGFVERSSRVKGRNQLDLDSLVYAALLAAVSAYELGEYDPGRAKLTTYARKSILGAIREEIKNQRGEESPPEGVTVLSLDGMRWVDDGTEQPSFDPPEQVPDASALEPSGQRLCMLCSGPIPANKRSHARFCGDEHRKIYHRRHKQDNAPEDKAESLAMEIDNLPKPSAKASEQERYRHRLLEQAAKELGHLRRYQRRLEDWLLDPASQNSTSFSDWKLTITDTRHRQTAVLMKGPVDKAWS
jgi:hypothetical protein